MAGECCKLARLFPKPDRQLFAKELRPTCYCQRLNALEHVTRMEDTVLGDVFTRNAAILLLRYHEESRTKKGNLAGCESVLSLQRTSDVISVMNVACPVVSRTMCEGFRQS